MDEGRSLLLGALARLDFVEGRPFQFTVFVSEPWGIQLALTTPMTAARRS